MSRKLRYNDEIIVLSGKDKGKRGKIQKIFSSGKAIVSGINMVYKHYKPNPSIQQPGGILKKESPIHLSNLAIYNIETEKSDKIGFKISLKKKQRFLKFTRKKI